MSEVVTFRCRGELAEWLEQEAERRMTTKSAVAQMLLAEKFREMKGEDVSNDTSTPSDGDDPAEPDDALDRHPDAWYRPDGKHNFAVRHPEGGERKYYKTRGGAEARVLRWYEGKKVDGRRM